MTHFIDYVEKRQLLHTAVKSNLKHFENIYEVVFSSMPM
jgi:hypothetical protein